MHALKVMINMVSFKMTGKQNFISQLSDHIKSQKAAHEKLILLKLNFSALLKAAGIMVVLGLGGCSKEHIHYSMATDTINKYYVDTLIKDGLAIQNSKVDLSGLVDGYESECFYDTTVFNVKEKQVREYFDCARVKIDALDIGQANLRLFLDDQNIKDHAESLELRKLLNEVKADNKVTFIEVVNVYKTIDQIDDKENKDKLS